MHLSGRYTGYTPCILPLHSNSCWSFRSNLSCRQLFLKDTDLALLCCTFLSHVPLWVVILLLLEAHAFLVCGRLLALCVNLVIHTLIRSIFQRLSLLNTSALLELKSSNDSLRIHNEPYKRVSCSQTQTTEGLNYCCRYLLTSVGCKISVDAGNVSAFWSRFQTHKYGFLSRGPYADLLAPDKQHRDSWVLLDLLDIFNNNNNNHHHHLYFLR